MLRLTGPHENDLGNENGAEAANMMHRAERKNTASTYENQNFVSFPCIPYSLGLGFCCRSK